MSSHYYILHLNKQLIKPLKFIIMYAQLFYISEEGNHYPQTNKLLIDDSLNGLLNLPEWSQGNDAYWNYTELNDRQINLIGGYSITDFNANI